eukprot:s1008_g4.t2
MQPRVCLHTFCSCPSCGAWILAWHLQNRQLLPRSAVGSSRLLLSLGVEDGRSKGSSSRKKQVWFGERRSLRSLLRGLLGRQRTALRWG